MCLILLAWRAHEDYPLAVAANRDEFHSRPSSAAAFWADRPAILAGRDLEAGGTWMGVSRSGRFAAVTNFRGAQEPRSAESRGFLVSRFLLGEDSAGQYVSEVVKRADQYSGFNLLVADQRTLAWMSNRGGAPRSLEPGIYALGNALLDAPEVEPARKRFAETMQGGPAIETLFSALAPARIVEARYGTRCSTVLLLGKDRRVRYAERSFSGGGGEGETVQYEFAATG